MLDLVPVVLFVTTGVTICTYFYFRFRARRELQETLRAAMERGQELTPQVLELVAGNLGGSSDMRRGMILIALAAGFGVLALVVETIELLGIAAFPLLVGIAYLVLWRFAPRNAT